MEPHKTYTRGNETLKIYPENDAGNPRKEFDNLGIMVCFHGRYDLGDPGHELSLDEAKALEADPEVIALPLYLYDHSGITMATTPFSCPWDSGKVGFIYVRKATVRKEYGWKALTPKRVAKIVEVLKAEVKMYDHYLTGNTYGFTIVEDGEIRDSCWGFYGADPATNGIFEEVGSDWVPVRDRQTA